MKEKKLAYKQKDIPKEERKGKVRQFFDRFKTHIAIGGVGLLLASTAGCGPSNGNCHPAYSPPAPVPIGYDYGFGTHCYPPGPHKSKKHKKKTPTHKLRYMCYNQKLEKDELAGEAEKLIKKGADVNDVDQAGRTIILSIIEKCPSPEKYDILKVLIENGASVNEKNPLMRAITGNYGHGDIKMAEFLLENGADVNAAAAGGNTPLHMAVKNEDVDSVKLLLKNEAYADVKNKYGETPLGIVLGNISSWEGYKCAKQEKVPTGSTYPWAEKYHYYCLENEYELNMFSLLNSPAEKSKNKARLEKNLEIAGLLLQKVEINAIDENGETLLLKASRFGNREIVKLLLKNGAQTELTDKYGRTALMNAVKNGDAEIAKLLLENGADVNNNGQFINSEGETLLLLTIRNVLTKEWIYNPEVIELLIGKGADVNYSDSPGNSALSLVYGYNMEDFMGHIFVKGASPAKRAEIAKVLLENGADPNTKIHCCTDITLLDEVAWSGYTEMAKPLIDAGADVNAQAGGLGTPLMTASSRWNEGMVKLLLASGADVNAKDAFGETALMKAAIFGCNKIIKILLYNGADRTIKNKDGLTAEKIALKHKNKDTAKLLEEYVAVYDMF